MYKFFLLFLSLILLTETSNAQVRKGYAIGVNDFKEYTYVDDPFVHKANISGSGIIEYKHQGSITTGYEGVVTLNTGIHRDKYQGLKERRTIGNVILETTHTFTISKNVNGFEPEIGVMGYTALAGVNSRQNYRLDTLVGVGYTSGNIKYGVRYYDTAANALIYKKYTLRQPDMTTYQVYREKTVKQKTDGVVISYQEGDKGPYTIVGDWQYYEPASKRITVGYYRKF